MSVVNLCASHFMAHKQRSPFTEAFQRVGKEGKERFDSRYQAVSCGNIVPKAILRRWPRTDVPKLTDDLRCDAKLMVSLVEMAERIARNSHQRMRSFDGPHQDVCIDKNAHLAL